MRTYYKNDFLMITEEKKKIITRQSKLIIQNRKTLLKSKLNNDVINIIIVFLYGDKSDREAFETKFMYFQYIYILRYNIKFCYRNQEQNHYLIGDNSKIKCVGCKNYCCNSYNICFEVCKRCERNICRNCAIMVGSHTYDDTISRCETTIFYNCKECINNTNAFIKKFEKKENRMSNSLTLEEKKNLLIYYNEMKIKYNKDDFIKHKRLIELFKSDKEKQQEKLENKIEKENMQYEIFSEICEKSGGIYIDDVKQLSNANKLLYYEKLMKNKIYLEKEQYKEYTQLKNKNKYSFDDDDE